MDLAETLNKFYHDVAINELRLMNEMKQSAGVSYNSMLYLEIIASTENCTASKLAKLLHISKPAVTMKLNELIKQGLLERTPSGTDGRVKYISVQPGLLREFEAYDALMCRMANVVESRYTKEESELFGRILLDIAKECVKEEENEKHTS